MSEKVNLERARLVEFDYTLPRDDHAIAPSERLIVNRGNRTDPFRVLANNDAPAPPGVWGTFREGDIGHTGTNITVLAEFPVTLADLIPEDCQAFRFKHNGLTDTAVFDMVFKAWEVTGHDGCHATLESLAEHFDIELDTVVPLTLTTHSDYVEARR